VNNRLFLFFLMSCFLISGCHVIPSNSIFDKSPAPKILPGYGGLSGRIIADTEQNPFPGISVHLAEVVRSDKKIVYIFDAANSPSTVSGENGDFSFNGIPSGEFVIILGDDFSGRKIVSTEEEKAQVWIIHPNQVTDAGFLLFADR